MLHFQRFVVNFWMFCNKWTSLEKTQKLKTQNNVILCTKSYKIVNKCMFLSLLWIFRFSCESRYFCGAEIFFDKSQILCQGKISETPQNTFIRHKNSKLRITWYCVWNCTKLRINVCFMSLLWIFRFSCESRYFCGAAIIIDKSQILCQGKISEIPQSAFSKNKNSKHRITWYCIQNDTKSCM